MLRENSCHELIVSSWSIFMTERCGSISAQWPPSIHDDIVSTPYPKPIHEYELVSLRSTVVSTTQS